MIRTRLFRMSRSVCVLTATAALLWSVPASAQTPRPASTARPVLSQQQTDAQRAAAARARRVQQERARAAAAARALREAQQPQYRLDDRGALVPDVRAEAAIIYNPDTGEVLWESNSQNQRSIASITKVMTAIVFLDTEPDLSDRVLVTAADVNRASVTYLRAGARVSVDDLLHLLLIASDNAAARVLARVSPFGSVGFINRMNAKAEALGLVQTHYADPSGLLADNVSSAFDMARLIAFASSDDRIAAVMRKQQHTVRVGQRAVTVRSTNHLVREGDVEVLGGKTGFIRRAGYCLATLLRLPEGGPQVAVVILGAQSNAGRFWETRHLFNWLAAKAEDLLGGAVEAASTAN